MRLAVQVVVFLPLLAQSPVNPIRFRDAAEAAGLRFTLDHSPTPSKHMIESMPGGVAAFDYDSDGRVDLLRRL